MNSFAGTPKTQWLKLAFVLLVCVSSLTLTSDTSAQRRRTSRRPAPTRARTTIDYSKFSHVTKQHQQRCNTCHKVPTENWQKVRSYPDIADYPDHDKCVSCHRQQFFRGNKPPICSVCHSKVSPRDDARFGFRNPSTTSGFSIEFPHDKHQDVIARVLDSVRSDNVFRPASFTALAVDEDKYNNCSICHLARDVIPPAPAAGWLDGFVPDKATFKTVPTAHESCFNCHWTGATPVSGDCAGCHKLGSSTDSLPARISMKFRHDGGGEKLNHIAECTTCHINITKSATLRGLKPDVPITACSECHNREGLRQDVTKELEAIDKNGAFVCVYCHTSDVGRKDPPAGHYLISGRTPKKRPAR